MNEELLEENLIEEINEQSNEKEGAELFNTSIIRNSIDPSLKKPHYESKLKLVCTK